jgi:hypothetical protein
MLDRISGRGMEQEEREGDHPRDHRQPQNQSYAQEAEHGRNLASRRRGR